MTTEQEKSLSTPVQIIDEVRSAYHSLQELIKTERRFIREGAALEASKNAIRRALLSVGQKLFDDLPLAPNEEDGNFGHKTTKTGKITVSELGGGELFHQGEDVWVAALAFVAGTEIDINGAPLTFDIEATRQKGKSGVCEITFTLGGEGGSWEAGLEWVEKGVGEDFVIEDLDIIGNMKPKLNPLKQMFGAESRIKAPAALTDYEVCAVTFEIVRTAKVLSA